MHSLRLLGGLVGFSQPFSFLYRLGFFLYTMGNLVSIPLFVNNIISVFTDKKKTMDFPLCHGSFVFILWHFKTA